MAGFSNDVLVATNFDFSGVTKTAQMLNDGEIIIGSSASPNVRVGTLTSSDATVAFTFGNGTIDLSATAGGALTFAGDAGTAMAALSIITFAGGTGCASSAAGSTVTFNVDATVPLSFPTDVGTATPAANALTVAGGTGLNTAGAGAIVTVHLDTPVTVANGGTGAITLTDGGIMLGSGVGAVTITAQPTNGQLLIGSTGTDPVLASLTAGTGITITPGAGSITIDATTTTPLSFPTDVGTATPAANAVIIAGGTGIDTSGAGATVTVAIESPVSVTNGGTGSSGITGIVCGTGAAYNGRTLTAPAAGFTISNANGSGGNPTFALANDLEAVENLASAGVVSRTGANAWDVSSVTQYAVQVGDAGYKLVSISPIGTSGQVLTSNGAGANPSWQNAGVGSGGVIQQVRTSTGALFNLSDTMNYDDSIPAQTEGDEIMTLAITPTNASSILVIEATLVGRIDDISGEKLSAALFRDATSAAKAAILVCSEDNTVGATSILKFWESAGSTSPTTYKIRAGCNSGSGASINGSSSSRRFGGVSATTLTITEFAS